MTLRDPSTRFFSGGRHRLPLSPATRTIRAILSSFAIAAACSLASPALADIWGYVDENGRSHIATEKLDDRYQLFFKGGIRVDPPDELEVATAMAAQSGDEFRRTPLFQRMSNRPNAARFEALIEQYAKMHTVDPALVKAVIAVESAYQPDAISPKGALGLMQIIPDTAARYGIVGDRKSSAVQKLLDPATNLRVGTRHLRGLLLRFADDLDLVLAAYNAGEGAVEKYARTIPPYPETRTYVKLVQKFYGSYRPAPEVRAPAPAPKVKRIVIPGQRNPPGVTRILP